MAVIEMRGPNNATPFLVWGEGEDDCREATVAEHSFWRQLERRTEELETAVDDLVTVEKERDALKTDAAELVDALDFYATCGTCYPDGGFYGDLEKRQRGESVAQLALARYRKQQGEGFRCSGASYHLPSCDGTCGELEKQQGERDG